METSHRAGYLLLQAVLGAAWWLAVFTWEPFASWFRDPAAPPSALHLFFPADALLIVVGSATAAGMVLWRSRGRLPVLWVLTGALGYAALYSLALSWWTDASVLPAMAMLPAAVATLVIACLEARA